MIQNITPITGTSTIEEINSNFEAIQAAIVNKQLAFHYLNLYNLKGSVICTASAITTAYNLLNLNEALLIVVNPNPDDTSPAEEQWRSNIILYAGDYLVKTTAGPLRVPGPTTGYYIPDVAGTGLTFTYITEASELEDEIGPFNIQGVSGGGYDLTYTLAVNTPQDFLAQYRDSDLIIPIIQIYDPTDNMLVDYPYTCTLSEGSYTLILDAAWSGKIFTVRVR